ncbi:hypothetical protein [Nocardioides sp.]|uniref:hypothetical protein n=1 Tax=Nocardioides sp. TaxID=35761 RepID=UPI0039E588E9
MKPALSHTAVVSPGADHGPDWWHREHPVFTPLTGFFSGLAFVLLVPALFAGLLEATLPRHTVQDLFPLVLLALVVPIALVARHHSRRFGLYFALGMAATAVVVLGVGWVVLQIMVAIS